jgi:hypothetical protein
MSVNVLGNAIVGLIKSVNKKTLITLGVSAAIFALGLAASAVGETKSKPFDSSTTPQEILDFYKSGLPFKQYISLTIKNPASAELIKQELGDSNIQCGGKGTDVRTNKAVCNQMISFMNQTCTVDPSISRNCEQAYISDYLLSQHLTETQQSKLSYITLARAASTNHPETIPDELIRLLNTSN